MRTILVVLASMMGLLPALACGAPPVESGAQEYVDPGHSHAAGQGVSQEQIIESVQKRYNAKVVRVTETTVEGRPALQLRLLSAQRVWTVLVDAESGRVLSGG
jgi:uncharacterized membrane protein YkoI